jgi:transcription antitermination factor NusG
MSYEIIAKNINKKIIYKKDINNAISKIKEEYNKIKPCSLDINGIHVLTIKDDKLDLEKIIIKKVEPGKDVDKLPISMMLYPIALIEVNNNDKDFTIGDIIKFYENNKDDYEPDEEVIEGDEVRIIQKRD